MLGECHQVEPSYLMLMTWGMQFSVSIEPVPQSLVAASPPVSFFIDACPLQSTCLHRCSAWILIYEPRANETEGCCCYWVPLITSSIKQSRVGKHLLGILNTRPSVLALPLLSPCLLCVLSGYQTDVSLMREFFDPHAEHRWEYPSQQTAVYLKQGFPFLRPMSTHPDICMFRCTPHLFLLYLLVDKFCFDAEISSAGSPSISIWSVGQNLAIVYAIKARVTSSHSHI